MTVNTRYGKITASKRTLNDISGDMYAAADAYLDSGCRTLALDAINVATEIHDALYMVGYFDNLK